MSTRGLLVTFSCEKECEAPSRRHRALGTWRGCRPERWKPWGSVSPSVFRSVKRSCIAAISPRSVFPGEEMRRFFELGIPSGRATPTPRVGEFGSRIAAGHSADSESTRSLPQGNLPTCLCVFSCEDRVPGNWSLRQRSRTLRTSTRRPGVLKWGWST